MKRITVMLAEDHAIVREGLRSLLGLDSEIEVVGEAATGRQAVELARKLRPTVVVMDIAMPLLNGFEATRQILLVRPAPRCWCSPRTATTSMWRHGRSRRVRLSGETEFRAGAGHAIKEIVAGHSYFSPSIAKRLGKRSGVARGRCRPRKAPTAADGAEAEVLQLVAEGAATTGPAELGISTKTVEKHRQQLMDKLNITTPPDSPPCDRDWRD